jgi:hypothetical protein
VTVETVGSVRGLAIDLIAGPQTRGGIQLGVAGVAQLWSVLTEHIGKGRPVGVVTVGALPARVIGPLPFDAAAGTGVRGGIVRRQAGEGLGLTRLIIDMAVNLDWVNSQLLQNLMRVNFLHFAILLFIISSAILFVVSFWGEHAASEEMIESSMVFSKENLQMNTLASEIKNTFSFKRGIFFALTLIVIVAGLLGFILS